MAYNVTTTEDREGGLIMSVRISARELEEVSQQLLVTRIDDMLRACMEALRDKVVTAIEPQVIAKMDVGAIANMATMRAGVMIGERVGAAVVPVQEKR
jgi:hypothetical protein